MDVTIINPQLSYLDFRCKDTAKILFHQTLSRKKIKKSSFFLKMLCSLDFYYSCDGSGSNRKWSHCRIVALSHRRIFLLHMRELYIWKGRMVLYLLYIIFIYYISIYINNRAHAGEVVLQCYNATMLQCYALFYVQKGPFPSEKSPSYAYVAPNFRQTFAATYTRKNYWCKDTLLSTLWAKEEFMITTEHTPEMQYNNSRGSRDGSLIHPKKGRTVAR